MESKQSEATRFVTALYKGMLLREPDLAGLQRYVAALVNGRSAVSIAEEFIGCAEFKALRAVQLFVPPGHFYSPVVNPAEVGAHIDRLAAQSAIDDLPGLGMSKERMLEQWVTLLPFLRSSPFPEQKSDATRYAFDNPAYSWGDGSILHAMLRRYKPTRLIEIGSGWSSACAIDTIEMYFNEACEVTFIEPFPQLLRGLLGPTSVRTKILEVPVQKVPLNVFDALKDGDFLFIDSTHVLRTGSDVCFELFEILPRLPSGVFVHIHDMFWPFEYPRSWVIDENRSWNEIYAVRALLTDNQSWRIVFFNDYFAKFARSEIEATYPQFLKNSGGALWLQRR
jgi:hypothetical protein